MKKLIISVFVMALSLYAVAQESFIGYSPYSQFGIGQIESFGDQNTMAMGGIGVAIRDAGYNNLLNPASVTARETQAFMLNFGLKQSNTIYSADINGSTAKTAKNLFDINHVVASFPIYKHSAFRLGVMPYSSTGYLFRYRDESDIVLSELGDVQYIRAGQGGLSQAFAGAGVTLFERLSLGADAILVFGTNTRNSAALFNTNSYSRTIARDWKSVSRGFTGKLGMQYEQPLGDLSLIVGATYKLGSTIKSDYSDLAYATGGNYTDTTINISMEKSINLPQEISVGFTLGKKDSWKIGYDYTMQDWTGSVFDPTPGINVAYGNSQSHNIGFEYIPNKYDVRYFLRTITYRVGAYHKNQYLIIDGHQISTSGITFGFSIPVYNRQTSVSLAVDLGRTQVPNHVNENFVKFTVGLNLYDVWFQKVLYN